MQVPEVSWVRVTVVIPTPPPRCDRHHRHHHPSPPLPLQAYRPLAHGEGSLLKDPTVKAIAAAHGKSAAQVALRWVLQLGHPLCAPPFRIVTSPRRGP